jgi:hypothetical protein
MCYSWNSFAHRLGAGEELWARARCLRRRAARRNLTRAAGRHCGVICGCWPAPVRDAQPRVQACVVPKRVRVGKH